jgi:hypothetical protein
MAMYVAQRMWRMYRPHRQQAGSYRILAFSMAHFMALALKEQMSSGVPLPI